MNSILLYLSFCYEQRRDFNGYTHIVNVSNSMELLPTLPDLTGS